MTSYLIVQKDGNVKESVVKQIIEEDLYKKAGFRTSDGFKLHTSWRVENVRNKSYNVHVYGKTDGRANQENKYEFPPPIENMLFFGSCILVNKVGENFVNLTASEWEAIYDKLYGGFDDVNSDEESESDEDDGLPRTKSGYVKDGFIVEDEEDEEEEEEEEEDDDDDDDLPRKKKRKITVAKKTIIKLKTKPKLSQPLPTVFNEIESELDCTNELCEEEYLEG